jgi:hypothetical protein
LLRILGGCLGIPRHFRRCCKSTIDYNGLEMSVDSRRDGLIALESKHKQEYRALTHSFLSLM